MKFIFKKALSHILCCFCFYLPLSTIFYCLFVPECPKSQRDLNKKLYGITIEAVCVLEAGERGIVTFLACIKNIAPNAIRAKPAKVFMNERDMLASGTVGSGHSQVENYTIGILTTRRVGLLNTAAEDKPQSGARGTTDAHASNTFDSDIPSPSVNLQPL